MFAVNPDADEVEGDRCYPDLRSIPGGVDWVVIGTRPQTAESTMRECAALGIRLVWMHRGPAGSAEVTARKGGSRMVVTPPALTDEASTHRLTRLPRSAGAS